MDRGVGPDLLFQGTLGQEFLFRTPYAASYCTASFRLGYVTWHSRTLAAPVLRGPRRPHLALPVVGLLPQRLQLRRCWQAADIVFFLQLY